MLTERCLDLDRIDVHAAADDHVLGAVDEEEVATRIEISEIPGPQPTVAQSIGGGLRVLVIFKQLIGRCHFHLADLANSRDPSVWFADADIQQCDRSSAGRQQIDIQVVCLRKGRDEVRALGLAEQLDEDRPEALQSLFKPLAPHRRRTIDDGAKAGRNSAIFGEVIEQPVEHGWDRESPGDRMFLRQTDELCRGEPLRQDHCPALGKAGLQVVTGGMRERCRQQHYFVGADIAADDGRQNVDRQPLLRMTDALGLAGCAAGVGDQREVIGTGPTDRQQRFSRKGVAPRD